MKKYLMVFLAVLLFSTAASAQTEGYIGLFADETRTSWCKSGGTFPIIFEMYIFCLPRADGMYCAEFMVNYPADPTVISATVTQGAGISIVQGDLASGVGVCYHECQYDWVWPFHQMIVLQSANQNMISIGAFPGTGRILFNNCEEPMRPIYDAVVFTNLYLQYVDGVDPECSETATAELTWGAIKSMYTE